MEQENEQTKRAARWLLAYGGTDQTLLDAQLDLDFGSSMTSEVLALVLGQMPKVQDYGAAVKYEPDAVDEAMDMVAQIRELKEKRKQVNPSKPRKRGAVPVQPGQEYDLAPGDVIEFCPPKSGWLKSVFAEWKDNAERPNPSKPGTVLYQEHETRRAVRVKIDQEGEKATLTWIPKKAIASIARKDKK